MHSIIAKLALECEFKVHANIVCKEESLGTRL